MLEDRWPPDDRFSSRAWLLAAIGVVVGGVVLLVVAAAVAGTVLFGITQPAFQETTSVVPAAGFDAIRTDAGVAVTMDGGDTMNASLVTVRVDDRRLGTWASLSDDGDGEVQAGDRIVLDELQANRPIAIVWDDGEDATTLDRVPVPGTARAESLADGARTVT